MMQERFSDTPHRLQHFFCFLRRACATPDNAANLLHVQVLREHRCRRDDKESEKSAHMFRSDFDEVPICSQDSCCFTQIPEGRTELHDVHWIKFELERGDHAEVSSTTAHGPEQIGIFCGTCRHKAAVGQNHVDAEQVIDG